MAGAVRHPARRLRRLPRQLGARPRARRLPRSDVPRRTSPHGLTPAAAEQALERVGAGDLVGLRRRLAAARLAAAQQALAELLDRLAGTGLQRILEIGLVAEIVPRTLDRQPDLGAFDHGRDLVVG